MSVLRSIDTSQWQNLAQNKYLNWSQPFHITVLSFVFIVIHLLIYFHSDPHTLIQFYIISFNYKSSLINLTNSCLIFTDSFRLWYVWAWSLQCFPKVAIFREPDVPGFYGSYDIFRWFILLDGKSQSTLATGEFWIFILLSYIVKFEQLWK